jgi:uncharacterized membrane protein YphA (DoxX/SURF4 family)
MSLQKIDSHIIHTLQKMFLPSARISLAVIFIWFGLLKVLGHSPASGLVQNLFDVSVPFFSFDIFYVAFAWFEILIGLLFLFPRFTRFVIPLLLIHMVTTFLPLFLLPDETWNGFMVLTLAGQYIVKNLVIVALALGVAATLEPLQKKIE